MLLKCSLSFAPVRLLNILSKEEDVCLKMILCKPVENGLKMID